MTLKHVFEDKVRAIFGSETVTDYKEYDEHHDVASMVLRFPTGVWLDLPKQLDALVDVLHKRDMEARFVGSDGLQQTLSADLRVELSGSEPPGDVVMVRHFKIMVGIDLLAAMDEVTERIGHRNVKAKFSTIAGSHVYMVIHAACSC